MTVVCLILLIVTACTSYLGLKHAHLFERYCFRPEMILAHKQYDRLLSSGFLHGSWMHFAMNALSLFCFGPSIEGVYGWWVLLVIHLGSILGGNLLALYFHRNHEYTAIGASGGVSGVIFAYLFLLPGRGVMIFPLPIPMPAWLYAIGFLLYSFFGMKNKRDNIGHDAHFGGAIFGVLLALAMFPDIVLTQKLLLVLVLVFSSALLWFLVRNPFLSAGSLFSFGQPKHRSNLRYQRYDESRAANQTKAEIDAILEKISTRGFQSLSASERTKLDAYSKTKRR